MSSIQQQRAKLEGKLDNLVKPLNQQKSVDFDRYRDNDDDEFDSFDDSDDDEHHNQHSKNDLSSKQLPEPPSHSGQVYAFVQRIKNFGSISKNEISKGISKFAKKRGSIPKIPASRSQFYENSDETNYVAPKYESKSLGKKSRGLAKLQKLGRLTINKLPTNFNLNDPFEHSGENENNSSPNLSKSLSNFNSPNADAVDKNDRNIKNMFRKGSSPSITSSSTSNIYGALSNKTSTFYVTDSVDVDSGIFAVNEKSTSSPDNSNLNLSSVANSSSTSSSCDMKRRSIASITSANGSRPNEPPPAPPTRRSGSTSWYAECGLFNHEEEHNHDDMEKNEKNANSWYTESGLYQTSNTSVAR